MRIKESLKLPLIEKLKVIYKMTEPIFLAIDTSTAQISVAIVQGDQVLAERAKVDPLRHAELASGLISDCLQEANLTPSDISIFICGIGPGPFTGLRVGVITAKVMALISQKPIYGICSHDAIAINQPKDQTFSVITDARRKEVYVTAFLGNKRINTPLVKKRETITAEIIIENTYPLAKDLIKQAQFALANNQKLVVENFILDEAENDGSKVELPQDILLPAIPLYLRVPDAKPAHG
jgi:tRNA threonylcarbamoyladenosine biosynthesis protein TsaB